MKTHKVPLCTCTRAAMHAKLGSILKGGDPAEILPVTCLLLMLRPPSRRKSSKKKGRKEASTRE